MGVAGDGGEPDALLLPAPLLPAPVLGAAGLVERGDALLLAAFLLGGRLLLAARLLECGDARVILAPTLRGLLRLAPRLCLCGSDLLPAAAVVLRLDLATARVGCLQLPLPAALGFEGRLPLAGLLLRLARCTRVDGSSREPGARRACGAVSKRWYS